MFLGVKLRPSPPMWKVSFRFAREHSFPLYLKKINCFEEMLYRKTDFTFWGVTLFKRALKCITLNKMKKAEYIMEIMRWCLPVQKSRFQLRILSVPLGKSHIGDWALSYALHVQCEKILLVWQGNIVSHYIWKKLTVLKKCCIEKATLHFEA